MSTWAQDMAALDIPLTARDVLLDDELIGIDGNKVVNGVSDDAIPPEL